MNFIMYVSLIFFNFKAIKLGYETLFLRSNLYWYIWFISSKEEQYKMLVLCPIEC